MMFNPCRPCCNTSFLGPKKVLIAAFDREWLPVDSFLNEYETHRITGLQNTVIYRKFISESISLAEYDVIFCSNMCLSLSPWFPYEDIITYNVPSSWQMDKLKDWVKLNNKRLVFPIPYPITGFYDSLNEPFSILPAHVRYANLWNNSMAIGGFNFRIEPTLKIIRHNAQPPTSWYWWSVGDFLTPFLFGEPNYLNSSLEDGTQSTIYTVAGVRGGYVIDRTPAEWKIVTWPLIGGDDVLFYFAPNKIFTYPFENMNFYGDTCLAAAKYNIVTNGNKSEVVAGIMGNFTASPGGTPGGANDTLIINCMKYNVNF